MKTYFKQYETKLIYKWKDTYEYKAKNGKNIEERCYGIWLYKYMV